MPSLYRNQIWMTPGEGLQLNLRPHRHKYSCIMFATSVASLLLLPPHCSTIIAVLTAFFLEASSSPTEAGCAQRAVSAFGADRGSFDISIIIVASVLFGATIFAHRFLMKGFKV